MIGKKRQERLWNHLMEVEKQVGMPLRTTPREETWSCPIENFAPDKNIEGEAFDCVGWSGTIYYRGTGYDIYQHDDGDWWQGLSKETRMQATRRIKNKLKERDNGR